MEEIPMSNPAAITQHLDIVESHEKADYLDSYMERVGSKVLVGYLSHDTDPSNPLEDSDGLGAIFSAHRNSRTHREMQEALGLDMYWSPDLELVDEHPDQFRKAWIEAAVDSLEFQQWCQEVGRPPKFLNPTELAAYYKRKAVRFWRDTGGITQNPYNPEDIDDFEFTDDVREEVWQKLAELHLIGDPDRVSLDVYEHSGVAYSVSGEGMQCPWDTASGGALWVPDDCAREEIDRRAQVYQYGTVVEMPVRKDQKFTFKVDGEEEVATFRFTHWHQAFDALAQSAKRKGKGKPDLGRRRAAFELASNAAEVFTDYCNGSVYGVVIETFQITDEATGATESVEENSCWGYFGSDHAESTLKSEFDDELNRLKKGE
jgi:hypothetical protein